MLLVLPSDHLIRDAEGFRDGGAPRPAVCARGLDRDLRDEARAARDRLWLYRARRAARRGRVRRRPVRREAGRGDGRGLGRRRPARLERRHLPDARGDLSRRAGRACARHRQGGRGGDGRGGPRGRAHPPRAGRVRGVARAVDRLCGDGESGEGRGRAGFDRLVRHRQLRGAARSSPTRTATAMSWSDRPGDRRARQFDPLGRAAGGGDRGRGSGDRRHRATRCWSCRAARASGSGKRSTR